MPTHSCLVGDWFLNPQISEIVGKLNPEEENLELLKTNCDELEKTLLETPLRSGRRKGAVLRSLFRLLDLKDAPLLLKITRIILQVWGRKEVVVGALQSPSRSNPRVRVTAADHKVGADPDQRLQAALQAVAQRPQRRGVPARKHDW